MELTLLRFCVEPVFAESLEDLLDMLLVGSLVLRVNEDVIQVDNDANIKEISKDCIDKLLECCRGVGYTEWHNEPFIGAIVCVERHFPLITLSDADQMVCVPEVQLGIYLSTAWSI